jgi:hypothetical protein
MRSDRVYQALQRMPNRFMLCNLTINATRRFHRSYTSVGQTINTVLDYIACSTPEKTMVERLPISSALEADRETTLCA